jgi:hypothetical protein
MTNLMIKARDIIEWIFEPNHLVVIIIVGMVLSLVSCIGSGEYFEVCQR